MKPIPFKDRLVVRLAVSMFAVALLSSLIMIVVQSIGLEVANIQRPLLQEKAQEILLENGNDPELRELFATPERIRNTLATSGIIALLISGVLWVVYIIRTSRILARPIEDVTLAAAQITNGDLSSRVRKPNRIVGESAQLLEHFNQMATSLENYENERTEMIASIAHELRTPLTVMRMRLDVMEDGLVDLNQEEVKLLSRQVDLLTRLVNDLRTLSLADANRLSLNLETIQLDEVIRAVSDAFSTRATENEIELVVELEPITSKADADRISQVVFNLLDNAFNYTPEGGTITLNLIENGNNAVLSVRDTGSGFEVDANELFKRFYSTHKDTGSSGIGLALVKAIVELHKGNVTAYNSPNGGAIFSVELPYL